MNIYIYIYISYRIHAIYLYLVPIAATRCLDIFCGRRFTLCEYVYTVRLTEDTAFTITIPKVYIHTNKVILYSTHTQINVDKDIMEEFDSASVH